MDREKALDMALKQIEKQYGAGALMKLGEDQQVQVPAIPTGALSLDLALGVGGLPRGRVVELFGPEASGKCLTADTYVWSDRGLETVEELFARCGQQASCTSRVTDVSDLDVRLVNEDGELEPMTAVTHNGRRRTWRIVLESGRSVTATARHPLRVLNGRGQIVWRKVEDMDEGDVVVSATFGAESATGGIEHLSEDEALLLGYLVAEGTLGESNRNGFTYTNHQDDDTFEEYLGLVERVLGIERERVKTYGPGDHAIHDTAARKVLHERYGLDYVNAPDKCVPQVVRTGGPKAQRAFLSALFEGDGWIEDGPEICLTTASEVLAEQVQLLLYGLGIPASLTQKWNSEYERHYHTVRIPPGGTARFLAEIGFRSARRADQVANHLRDGTWPNTKWEAVPGIADLVRDLRDVIGGDREIDRLYHDLSRSDLTVRGGGIDASRTRLEAIVTWAESKHVPPAARPLLEQLRAFAEQPYTYERIVAIEDAGEQPTFDVVVPRTHSFVANGILSHNTTVALHVIAEAQKLGGIAAFIDAEHALDPVYARAIGVDVDELLVSQPDTGEQALEITDMLVRSGAVDIIAIDSVAALVPRAEIEGEMGDTHVGLQARLMSQAMRKLSGSISKSKTTVVFINQLREKIGVMFGCMSYSTRVTLADGTQEKIGKIVNQKMDVEVLSYDRERGEIVPKRVTDWFDNGPTDEFLRFTVARGGGNGRSQFACTANHQIMTPGGWREAQELEVGDRVVQSVPHHLSDFQWEVLLGGLMGDSALSPTRSGHGARLRWGHGERQADYSDWKASLFSNLNVCRTTNDQGAVFHDVQPLPELADLREAVYWEGSKVLSHDYLKRLTPLSLAIWYMDDGSFRLRAKGLQERTKDGSGRSQICVQALEPTSRTRLAEYLRDTWDLDVNLSVRGKRQIPYLVFNKGATARFHALIAPFVHPSMQYKLLPKYRGRFDVEPAFASMRYEPVPMPIVEIEAKPPNGRATHRFDIEVEGTHNYFVDGVMVHNSPETTPGGRALKFYSSVRLDVRRIESLKDGSDFVGSRVRVKVVKNKVSSPFRQAEFDILFGEGISKEGAILDVGLDAGIVNKAGAWYQYGDDNLGQGRENARVFLKENDDIAREIEKKAKEALGLIPTNTAEGDDAEADEADESDADDES